MTAHAAIETKSALPENKAATGLVDAAFDDLATIPHSCC